MASSIVAAVIEVGFSLVWVGSRPLVLKMSWDSVTDKILMSTDVSRVGEDDEWKEGRVGVEFCGVKLTADDGVGGKVELAADAYEMDVDLPLAVKN